MKITIDKGVKHDGVSRIRDVEAALDEAMDNIGLFRVDTRFTDYATMFEYSDDKILKNIVDKK